VFDIFFFIGFRDIVFAKYFKCHYSLKTIPSRQLDIYTNVIDACCKCTDTRLYKLSKYHSKLYSFFNIDSCWQKAFFYTRLGPAFHLSVTGSVSVSVFASVSAMEKITFICLFFPNCCNYIYFVLK